MHAYSCKCYNTLQYFTMMYTHIAQREQSLNEWYWSWMDALHFNSLRSRQNGRHFADDTFKPILLNENIRISIKISLKIVPKVLINNIPALVQIMARRRPGDKPLSEPMMVCLLTHICVTRPQWVNHSILPTNTNSVMINNKQFTATLFSVKPDNYALAGWSWLNHDQGHARPVIYVPLTALSNVIAENWSV